ncbi:hypothetical protein [Tenacibaculum aiptasiae]|uniref:hypothetical protein n=1 Tax=Tenacibaculum aiptasiae TaxID=426481 RepID=UPI00232A9D1B|nr:hypothetical protein [Tenacibaculum aiptasiae]
MKLNIVVSLFLIGSFFSCSTPNIVVSSSLKNNTSIYEVTGRQGWQFNQIISFGNFKTSKIKRGWNLGYNIPFKIHFKGAKEKLSFIQNTTKEKAQVNCIGKFKSTEYNLIEDFFAIELSYKNYFAGSISIDSSKNNWNFILHEPDGNSLKNSTFGFIKNSKNKQQIIIKPVKKIEGQANWIQIDNHGFEFLYNGTSIAAVSLLNNGRVWIKNDLSNELQTVISSVASALLVRHNLEESLN